MKTFFQLREETSGQTIRVPREIFEAALHLMVESQQYEDDEYDDDLDEELSPEKKKAMKLGAQLTYSGMRGSRSGARLQAKHMDGTGSGRVKAASDLMKKHGGTAASFNKGAKAGDDARGTRDAHMARNWKPKKQGGYVSGPVRKLPEDYDY